ncbi:aldo/keto reductase [Chryseobacterium sp. MEBOG06]|uniref:aldo/keto reductase n=1 Tax=unclassified Chryseobacterium TaxID=2593645 RepID=UPI001F4817C0|nr:MULTISPECIES: aldo/keto reductase [unclassified Chryseobacterium]UKB85776.1 aldo/keto reductase [Chryseobacterium sp. MEBOG06]
MEYRLLGNSGLYVSELCFGTGTFGGVHGFEAWGSTQVADAKRIIDICIEAGINFFDTADIYSQGVSEEILGKAIEGKKREDLIISTKSTFPFGEGPNNQGSSRQRIIQQVEGSLKRMNTDYIDVYHMHGFDAVTPVEETLRALDDLIEAGKIRYIACSNFSGWHLMKSLSISEKYGWNKYIAHQVYYALTNRDYEWELMPLAEDQKVGAIVWSPLAGGRLGGKFSRSKEWPTSGRVAEGGSPVHEDSIERENLYRITDVLEAIADETQKTVPQVALNWLLQRPTISTLIIGARNEEQLRDNLGATGWKLTEEQIQRLNDASKAKAPYPYWHQTERPKINPAVNIFI